MSFIVVLCHCWNNKTQLYPINTLLSLAVPTFMFVSFFLTQKGFMRKDKTYIHKRMYKLILPQVVWSVIYFIVYSLLNRSVSLLHLLVQIVTGHSPALNPAMWFQVNLIIFSVLFFIVFYFCNEKLGTIVVSVLFVLCLFLQYSGLNYKLFGALRYELCYPLGRLAEVFPAAILGFIVAKYNLLRFSKTIKSINVLLGLVLAICFLILDCYLPFPSVNFQYAGIWKLGFAYGITMFAYNLDFKFFSNSAKKIISNITNFTQGIYCSHNLICVLFYGFISVFGWGETGKFYQCIIIFILCYIMCQILNKIPLKWIKNLI
jgi:fucose 4-O-acetylase-like acetyltransferase